MANASDQFRQSDVTYWGIVALCCGGLAVLAANVSALLPSGVLLGLHSTRIGGASVEQLRAAVSELQSEAQLLRRENEQMTTRFTLHEQSSNEAVRRLGALEVSLPRLLEALPGPGAGASFDRSLPTASIGASGAVETFEAEGGSVRVELLPFSPPSAAPAASETGQPLPAPLTEAPEPDRFVPFAEGSFGIAIGPAIAAGEADALWDEMARTLGPLLAGFDPLLATEAESGASRLIAGPTTDFIEANVLCGRLTRIDIACEPMPYTGLALLR